MQFYLAEKNELVNLKFEKILQKKFYEKTILKKILLK